MYQHFLSLNCKKVSHKITGFISEQVKLRKKNGIVLGLSGGLD